MKDHSLVRTLEALGLADGATLARTLDVSENTVSRLARENSKQIVKLGGSKNTRYALREPILGLSDIQQLYWVDTEGKAIPFAMLNHLHGGRTHLSASGWSEAFHPNQVPWPLAGAVQVGYLGRAIAQGFVAPPFSFDSIPERWTFTQHLFVALNPNIDLPGAILIGEAAVESWKKSSLAPNVSSDEYDALTHPNNRLREAGTSAGGEQPKFSALRDDKHLLVKLSPPRGTPSGETWHDLLHCEAIAARVLESHGILAAKNRIVETSTRTYLESERIDRVGRYGRRHALPLFAIHARFVGGAQQRWPRTAAALVAQRRLSKEDAHTIAIVFRFGELIGNNDMHFGNLSLIADTPEHLRKGRFRLAPIYDMLPMRYRPETAARDFPFSPFTPSAALHGEEQIDQQARSMAKRFWQEVSEANLQLDLRELANMMQRRVPSPIHLD